MKKRKVLILSLLFFSVCLNLIFVLSGANVFQHSVARSDKSDCPIVLQPHDDLRALRLKSLKMGLSASDLRNCGNIFETDIFDTETPWPKNDKMPRNFNPEKVMEDGKNPGMAIRDLNAKGLTGKGVNVAIIDQPLLTSHAEIAGKLAKYTEIGCKGRVPEMHSSAVSSLLVGKTCGVAPSANLYFWAIPMWERDYKYCIEAFKQILDFNKDKKQNEKIRVVSCSMSFNLKHSNARELADIVALVEKSGVIVLHCDGDYIGARCKVNANRDDPDNYVKAYFSRNAPCDKLCVPISNRTVAGFQHDKQYTFWGEGGLSWGAPWLAGVIALGFQANPHLKSSDIFEFLDQTAVRNCEGLKLVNPSKFIEMCQKHKIPNA